MNYLSVCSGIEAASVAWGPLGWSPAGFAEIEAFPSALLAARYPETPNHGDMTKFREWPDAAIDVLVGGTPCQSFSVAGLRKGLADPRGNLALTYLAIADRYRPEWVVWENVPGVLSSSGGRDFGAFLGGLGQLGYGFAYRVLDAQYVRVDSHPRAVPQRRRRVFVVGHLGDWRRAAAVLFEPESLSGDPPPRREAGQGTTVSVIKGAAIGREPSAGPQFGEHLSDGSCYTLNCTEQHAVVASTDGVSHCLNAGGMGRQDWESETLIAHSLRADGFDAASEHVTPSLDKSKTPAVAFTCSEQSNSFAWERDVYPTLDAQIPNDTSNIQKGIRQGWAVRRLTPTECERLQGFPDNYTAITYRGKPAADGPRYKALGNSMAVNCMAWLGRRIDMVSSLQTRQEAA